MGQGDQKSWEHSIPAEVGVTGPRVSLTFRKLIPTAPFARQPVPQIVEPDMPANEPKRVLVLTDSMFNFEKGWGEGTQVVRKKMYQLTHLDRFEHLFNGTDLVLVNAGVNDLSRYGERAYSLARRVETMLANLTRRHPRTTFVLNTVLLTHAKTIGKWLNEEIMDFNHRLFEMSLHSPNLRVLDTDWMAASFCQAQWGPSRVGDVYKRDGNGIHLSSSLQSHLESVVISCTSSTFTPHRGITWWLRPRFHEWAAWTPSRR